MSSLWSQKPAEAPKPPEAAATVGPSQVFPPGDVTGSIRPPLAISPQAPARAPERPERPVLPLGAEDWERAHKALLEALAERSDTASVPWENAARGARGTMTALQASTGADGLVCRSFLGSAVADGKDSWFEGRACRQAGKAWEITDVRPWRRG